MRAWPRVTVVALVAVLAGACASQRGGMKDTTWAVPLICIGAIGGVASGAALGGSVYSGDAGGLVGGILGLVASATTILVTTAMLKKGQSCKSHSDCAAQNPDCNPMQWGYGDCVCEAGKCVAGWYSSSTKSVMLGAENGGGQEAKGDSAFDWYSPSDKNCPIYRMSEKSLCFKKHGKCVFKNISNAVRPVCNPY